MGQWLRLQDSAAGGMSWIPPQGTKIPHAVEQAQGPQLQNLWATAEDST